MPCACARASARADVRARCAPRRPAACRARAPAAARASRPPSTRARCTACPPASRRRRTPAPRAASAAGRGLGLHAEALARLARLRVLARDELDRDALPERHVHRRYTVPIAPRPISSSRRYLPPITSPGRMWLGMPSVNMAVSLIVSPVSSRYGRNQAALKPASLRPRLPAVEGGQDGQAFVLGAAVGLARAKRARFPWRPARTSTCRDSASTLASFHLRAPRAVSASTHSAARTPGTLFAAMLTPVPVQQQTTPCSCSPAATASATL